MNKTNPFITICSNNGSNKMNAFFTKAKDYLANAGIYLTASLISSLLAVLINPLLAMNLSPEDYAVSTYYTSFSLLYGPVMGFFITDFYLRKYYLLSNDDLFKLKGNVIKLFIWFSGAVSVVCLLGLYAFVKGVHVSFDFFPYAALAVFQSFLGLLFTFQQAEYKIARQAKPYFWTSVIFGVINTVLSLLLVVVIKYGAVGKMTASFLGSLIPFLWVLLKNRQYLNVKLDKQIFKQIFSYGYPLVLAASLTYFTNGYDKVVLERGGDIISLGYYSVACSIAAYITIFSNAIKGTFQPDMYQAIAQKNVKKVVGVAMLVIASVGAIVLLYIIFCPFLIRILTAGRYMESTEMSRIVSISVLTSTIYYQISQFTYGTGHSKLTLINKIVGTVINIGLIIWLIHNYGAIGAAWSSVLGYVVFAIGNILLLLIIRKKLFEKNEIKNT